MFTGQRVLHLSHGEHAVLSEVSLSARRGEMIVIVGENGAGKSTLAKLMCRLYDPQAGQVLWNGVDVRSMHLVAWYRRIAVVNQDFARFPLTFRENVGVGRVAHLDDDEQLMRAAEAAGLGQVLKGYPHGIDTVLTKQMEEGTEPSGGQWQRIAIARALMRSPDSEILIVDEPTAALDAKAEHDVFQLLRSISRERVAVVISHRLALAREADQIVVLEHGRVVEHGTHDVLMGFHGVYHSLIARMDSAFYVLRHGGTRTPPNSLPSRSPPRRPEHFDLAISLDEVNYGVSPGDAAHAHPFLYVGPWTPPAGGGFWNAPFGALRPLAELPDAAAVVRFFAEGRATPRT